MRRLFPALSLFVAACSTAPLPPEPQPVPVTPTPRPQGSVIGLTAPEVVRRLGNPALQVREGTSLKLQFRSRSCVLDAYLYPTTGGQVRVTHVDARLPSGADTAQAGCLATLETPAR